MMVFLRVKYCQGFKEAAATESTQQLSLEQGRLLGLAAFDRMTSSYRQKRRTPRRYQGGDQNYAVERRLGFDHRRRFRPWRRHGARDGGQGRKNRRARPEQGKRRKSR